MSVVAITRAKWGQCARLRLVVQRLVPRQIPFLAGAVLTVSVLVLGIAGLQAVLSETSFKMRELSRRATQLQADHSRLKLIVAELSSPERIAREARKLGLEIPTRVRTLSVAVPRQMDPAHVSAVDRPVSGAIETQERP